MFNNAQINFSQYSFDLATVMDPESLSTLVINNINYTMKFNKLNGGDVAVGKVPMMEEDTTLRINSAKLKEKNKSLYTALENPQTSGLGKVVISTPEMTLTYSKCLVVQGIKQVANNVEFQDITVKFIK